jgi:hypothetical protein
VAVLLIVVALHSTPSVLDALKWGFLAALFASFVPILFILRGVRRRVWGAITRSPADDLIGRVPHPPSGGTVAAVDHLHPCRSAHRPRPRPLPKRSDA